MSGDTGREFDREVMAEQVWDRLWPQLALRDGFWLGYLFCSDLAVVNVLVKRADDYARLRVKGTQLRTVRDPGELPGALTWLLSDHDAHLGLTWVVGIAGDPPPWRPAWARFLRRLNERRGALTGRLPGGLVLCLPESLLPTARDSAPDLWSFRSMVVEPARPQVRQPQPSGPPPDPGRPPPGVLGGRAALPATEPSAALRPTLRLLTAALQSGDTRAAVEHARSALAAAGASGSAEDVAIAHAWLARALESKEDLAGAIDHARQALDSGVPLGPQVSEELLEILASSPDLDTVLAARESQLALTRRVLAQNEDSADALRALSIALDEVADIQAERGQLDNALTNYTESLTLARQIHTTYGDTPQTLRDLTVSLEKIANIQTQRGQLDNALTNYTESLDVYRRLMDRYGTPLADPDELAWISDRRERVLAELARREEPPGDQE